jgi:phosphoserine phosphatase
MEKRIFASIIFAILLLLSISCHKEESQISNSLDKLNWSERNFLILNQLITDYGIGGKFYNEKDAPYIVLDWDQTCAHLDVEEAVMRYQLFHLRYKMTKDQFRGLLKDNINSVTQFSESFSSIKLDDINQDLIEDYSFFYDNYLGLDGTMTLEQIKLTSQYNDFIAKIPFLYDAYCSTTGIGEDYGYQWVLYLFTGMTKGEVKALATEAIIFELGNQLSKQTLISPTNLQTKAGVVQYSYKTGLRVIPEMQDLISTFEGHGIDVFIVSASYKPVVEVFSGIGTFGYNIPSEKVIGMELELNANGLILPEYKTGWVKTFRQGKVDAINQLIKRILGKKDDPLFASGDSDGDYEMLTSFPDMKLALIWNRVKGGDIGTLCKKAVDEMDSTNPRYILQGRNENTGCVIPCSESILLGKTELQLLK